MLDPGVSLSTLVSNTLRVRFSLNVRDRILHSYTTAGKIIIPYVLILEDPGVDGRIILKWIFERLDRGAWTGSIWLRIGTGGGLL
jgi:hypothetical protein